MKNKECILKLIFLLLAIVSVVYIFVGQKNNQTNVSMLWEEPVHNVSTQEITYYDNVTGFYATPMDMQDAPGIVIIHEWWGLNENIKQMARQLAGEGYAVLAVDLYEGEVAQTSERARELSRGLDQIRATENLQAAVGFLESRGAQKVASLGWCFGGGQSLQLALSGQDLDATIIYYGNITSDEEQLQSIEWPVLGIFGAQDAVIPVENVEGFKNALSAVGIDHEIYLYEGVGHAFANPSGDNFAPEQTIDAWQRTTEFLERTLKSN